jgi:antitoxin (DNA-binding transcriptional repressor) of toxin-antitoxin stability system
MLVGDMNEEEGFIRFRTEEFRGNLPEMLRRVMLEGQRLVLQQAEEEVAAIIPIREFERLGYLMEKIKPSPFLPSEEEYYEDEQGIHCIDLDELQTHFDQILVIVRLKNELFGLLQPDNLGELEFDISPPVAILMNINYFWVPDYQMSEKNRLWQHKE